MPSRSAFRALPDVAVAYVRVSTGKQELGPVAQRDAIAEWGRRNGVRIAEVFQDEVSGGVEDSAVDPFAARPALAAALDAVPLHRASVLVVAKRDRLHRDMMLAAMVVKLLSKHGARVVSAAGEGCGIDADPEDPASVLMRNIVDSFSVYERALIKYRTRKALAVKRDREERVGAVRLGFVLADEERLSARTGKMQTFRLLPNWPEREAAILAYRLHAEGLRGGAISEALVAAGHRPRNGADGYFRMQIQRLVALGARLSGVSGPQPPREGDARASG